MTEERPLTIRWFEALVFASLALGAINFSLDQNRSWAGFVFTIGIVGTLTLLISRGRKNWARWVLTANFSLGLAFMVWEIRALIAEASPLITLIISLLQGLAVVLLFTSRSSAWFRKRESLAETFR